MNQPSPHPKFSILQAQLKRHQIDCYKILNTQYHSCIHRPSSTRCLIYFWDAEWKLAGNANAPAYQIARVVLNKLANQTRKRSDPTATQEDLRPPTANANRVKEIAP